MRKVNPYLAQLREGLIDKNPTLVQLLGTCPMLATTTSASNAIGMGLSTAAVLIFSNLLISLLRKFIPQQVRIASYIIIISGFVSMLELLIKAYLPALDKSLGLFIPLICVNCILLARAEAFASKNKPIPSIMDGFAMGMGFTFALFVIGALREIIGSGSFLGFKILGSAYIPAAMFILPSGAFLTLGFVIAFVQHFKERIKAYPQKKLPEKEEADI